MRILPSDALALEGDPVVAGQQASDISGVAPSPVLDGAGRGVLVGRRRPPLGLSSLVGKEVADEVLDLADTQLERVGLLAFEIGQERIVFGHHGQLARLSVKINGVISGAATLAYGSTRCRRARELPAYGSEVEAELSLRHRVADAPNASDGGRGRLRRDRLHGPG